MLRQNRHAAALIALGTAVLVLLPHYVSNYVISVFILLYANVALATAWAFFSGTTRYISLATAAFFGVGIYVLAITHVYVPIAVALLMAAVVGFLVALVVGLSTLRLRGVYFVVFTFGLTELVHQIVNWWSIKTRTVTRYIFTDVPNVNIYYALLAAALVTIVGSWYVSRIRLGFALRAIGEDETVARHTGINTTRVKVVVLRAFGLGDGVRRRRARPALPLYRCQHRLQQQLVLPGADRGPARRADAALGPGRRRHPAGAAVGVSGRQLPAPLLHRARPVLRGDRVLPAGRHRPAARALRPVADAVRRRRPTLSHVTVRFRAGAARFVGLWRL